MTLDIRILGGDVLDGTGAAARRMDVGIVGDRIADMGDLGAAASRATVDAAGKVVCPGFIDAHSHSDTYLLIQPTADSKIYQGVTTEVVGNCGASGAPLMGAYRMPSDWADKAYPRPWKTLAEYRACLEEAKPAVNVVFLVGHNTLRAGIMGYERKTPAADDLDRLCRAVEEAMDGGARGLSTGLLYMPGKYAGMAEMKRLAAVVARRGGIYTSHMRSEGAHLLESIADMIAIGRETGVRTHISHLKTSGRDNWRLLDPALDRIRAALREGVDLGADRYPYTASCTDLDVILPEWAAGGGREAVLARLKDAATRSRIRADVLKTRGPGYWPIVTVGSTRHPDNRRFQGRRLVEVASALGLEPVDAALRLMETDELGTSAFFSGMSEENMFRILAEPFVALGSDASIRAPAGPLSLDYPHPRAYGAFARFLRLSLDGKTVALPEAIRKMTSLPADRFRLEGRGRLRIGAHADVVVFDPLRVRDISTYADPHRLAEGVETVFVNGRMTLHEGGPTGTRAGIFL